MADIAVADEPRTALSGPRPTAEVEARPPVQHGLYGDELRARAWLWRRLGIGTYAVGGRA
ncbi:hypothetical protein [Streptomyces sp. NPDC013489]|uniref:hypothetical protein n=1 Tax=Streptomyces sp. NPDC013489 TaxID=3155606 RepID=UPI0033DCCC9B